jgi:hypothetical protein
MRIVVLVLGLVAAPIASAIPITFNFSTGPGSAGIDATGYDLTPLSGSFTYESSFGTDNAPDPGQAIYEDVFIAFDFISQFGGVSGSLVGPRGGDIDWRDTGAVESIRITFDATEAWVVETAIDYTFGTFLLGVAATDSIFLQPGDEFRLLQPINPLGNPRTVAADVVLEFPDENDPLSRLQVSYELLSLQRVETIPLPGTPALFLSGAGVLLAKRIAGKKARGSKAELRRSC